MSWLVTFRLVEVLPFIISVRAEEEAMALRSRRFGTSRRDPAGFLVYPEEEFQGVTADNAATSRPNRASRSRRRFRVEKKVPYLIVYSHIVLIY